MTENGIAWRALLSQVGVRVFTVNRDRRACRFHVRAYIACVFHSLPRSRRFWRMRAAVQMSRSATVARRCAGRMIGDAPVIIIELSRNYH